MVVALFCSAALLTAHALLSIGMGLRSGREIDWAFDVFGALFFALVSAALGRQAASIPVATRSARTQTAAMEVRGRLTPFFYLVAMSAAALTTVNAAVLCGIPMIVLDSGFGDEAMNALLMGGFLLLFTAVVTGYAVGLVRAGRIVLIAMSIEGVSVATCGEAPTLLRWDETRSFSRARESTYFPLGPGDVDHHLVWRFDDLSVRTPIDLRPDVVDIDRELRRLAPHLFTTDDAR